MNEELQLRVRFDVGTDVLEVNYTVTNKGGRTAYLLNRLFETKPDWKLQRHRVLVELEGADKEHLAKRIPDMPLNRPVLPRCRRICGSIRSWSHHGPMASRRWSPVPGLHCSRSPVISRSCSTIRRPSS